MKLINISDNIKENFGKIKLYKLKEFELERYLELFLKMNTQLENNLKSLNSTDTLTKNSLVWEELNKYMQNDFKIIEAEYISQEKAKDILKSYIYFSQDVWNKYVNADTYEYYSSGISSYEFLNILVTILVDVNRHHLINQFLKKYQPTGDNDNTKIIQRLLIK